MPHREKSAEQFTEGSVDSEPGLAAAALPTLFYSDEPPLRLLLGSTVYDLVFDIARTRTATWAVWEQVSRAAGHATPGPATAVEESAAKLRRRNP